MKIPAVLVLAASIGTAASGIARADETLKFRLVMHVTGVQTQEVPDVDGHTMSVIKSLAWLHFRTVLSAPQVSWLQPIT
jgi:hypothetical protein